MPKKAWLNPRKKKIVKSHTRVTKKGVQFIEPFLHDYPKADKLKPTKADKKAKKEELSPSKNKRQQQIEEAKNRLACSMGL